MHLELRPTKTEQTQPKTFIPSKTQPKSFVPEPKRNQNLSFQPKFNQKDFIPEVPLHQLDKKKKVGERPKLENYKGR